MLSPAHALNTCEFSIFAADYILFIFSSCCDFAIFAFSSVRRSKSSFGLSPLRFQEPAAHSPFFWILHTRFLCHFNWILAHQLNLNTLLNHWRHMLIAEIHHIRRNVHRFSKFNSEIPATTKFCNKYTAMYSSAFCVKLFWF